MLEKKSSQGCRWEVHYHKDGNNAVFKIKHVVFSCEEIIFNFRLFSFCNLIMKWGFVFIYLFIYFSFP